MGIVNNIPNQDRYTHSANYMLMLRVEINFHVQELHVGSEKVCDLNVADIICNS